MSPSTTDTSSETIPESHSEILPTVTFYEALRFWLQLGFISFGGPAGQISIMHGNWLKNATSVGKTLSACP